MGPEENTRPDTVPAALRFAELSSPDLDAQPNRELAPYPGLSPRFDEPTVSYGIVSPVVEPREPSVADASTESSSGARHRAASTVPPPSRTRAKTPVANDVERIATPLPGAADRLATPLPSAAARLITPLPGAARIITPLPGSAARIATPLPSVPPAPLRASVRAPGAAPHDARASGTRLVLVAAVCSLLAAALGASLGNGSLLRAVDALLGTPDPLPTPAALAPVKAAPPNAVAPAPQPAPAAVTTSDASPVPVLRLQDLPPNEREESAPEPEPQPKPQRQPRKRR